jgi:hypothetical protein
VTAYLWDTNAGPIVTRDEPTAKAMRSHVEAHVPLLRRRGYSSSWRRSGSWHVMDVANSKGRIVHSCAFRPEKPAGVPTGHRCPECHRTFTCGHHRCGVDPTHTAPCPGCGESVHARRFAS